MSPAPKIKLLIDAHAFDNEFQGTRTFIKELYKELVSLSYNIEYYIAAANIDNLKREFDFIPEAHFIQYRSHNSFYRIYVETPQIIRKHRIDIAHFQYIAPLRAYCKYIVTTHDILFNDFKSEFSLPYRLLRNFVFRQSISHAAVKTTVSDYSRSRLAYHYHLNESSIHVIPNGVSDKFYAPYNKQEAKKYIADQYKAQNFILYVSRIEPRKNNILLLQAYLDEKMYEKNIALVFIGKTSIKSQALDDIISSMPEAAKKLFYKIEQVNDADLIKFYQAAELFVYPSKAEGFGIPPLEAAALQVPVLCSNRTAMSDYRFFGDNFFDPADKQELSSKINRVLFGNDKTDYQMISAAIRENYSWKSSAGKLFALLKKEFSAL